MKRKLLALLALNILLFACEKENVGGSQIDNEISFTTRGVVTDNSNIADMTMLCYETGTDDYVATSDLPNHMYLAKVSRGKEGTTFFPWIVSQSAAPAATTPKLHWSQGNKHSFAAIAPHNIVMNNFTPANASTAGLPSFTYTTPDEIDAFKDVVYALTLNQLDNFIAINPADRGVSLYFKHALTKLQFTAQLENNATLDEGESFQVIGLVLQDYQKTGMFQFANTTSNTSDAIASKDFISWTTSGTTTQTNFDNLSSEIIAQSDADYLTKKVDVIGGEEALFMIPQYFGADKASIKISYIHTSLGNDGILKEYTLTLPSEEWVAGKALAYNLRFDPANGASPWAAKATATDWENVDENTSSDGGDFTLPEGKRTYTWADAADDGVNPRTIAIPFETNIALENIEVETKYCKSTSFVGNSLIYTESYYGAADDDVVAFKLKVRDGSDSEGIGNVAYRVISVRISGERAIMDYTNQYTVSTLTGLSNNYGGVDANKVRVSNCYITAPRVELPTVFYIPIVDRVNEFWTDYGGNTANKIDAADWTTDPAYSVELSWYDGSSTSGLTVEKGFSPISSTYTPQNAIKVTQPSNFEEQNYVINILKNGTIIWSIHCWATDYNPYRVKDFLMPKRTSTNQALAVGEGELHSYADAEGAATPVWGTGNIYGDKFIMDRSLGALEPTFVGNGDGGKRKGGLYYAYGRKDPFLASIHTSPGKPTFTYTNTRMPFAQSVKEPLKFYTSPNSNWNTETYTAEGSTWYWCDIKIKSSTVIRKSIFDPSPLGFKVPIRETWNNFNNDSFKLSSAVWSHTSFSNAKYYMTGYMSGNVLLQGINQYGEARTSTPDGTNRDWYFEYIYNNGRPVQTFNAGRSYALLIRPIQE